jgi:hypothetical protein
MTKAIDTTRLRGALDTIMQESAAAARKSVADGRNDWTEHLRMYDLAARVQDNGELVKRLARIMAQAKD